MMENTLKMVKKMKKVTEKMRKKNMRRMWKM
jgi:hypothetical protein